MRGRGYWHPKSPSMRKVRTMQLRGWRGKMLMMPLTVGVMVCMLLIAVSMLSSTPVSAQTCKKELKLLTWNVAAVNNNPFEYWITHEDAGYASLMEGVQKFISEPGEQDVEVEKVFTESMFDELIQEMTSKGAQGLAEVTTRWKEDLKGRKIISGFIKDKKIGKKRLASMPDRVTNSIHLDGGGLALRPTVINCMEEEIPDMNGWWKKWRSFMFKDVLSLPKRDGKSMKKVGCAAQPFLSPHHHLHRHLHHHHHPSPLPFPITPLLLTNSRFRLRCCRGLCAASILRSLWRRRRSVSLFRPSALLSSTRSSFTCSTK